MKLTRADRRLLNELQKDATRNQTELAEVAGMSRTSCWRRMRDFEESGLIEKQVALLNPRLAGFHIHVVLAVSMTEHTDENRQDMESYTEFLNSRILKHPAVRSASSTFVLRRVKYTTMLPLAD